MQDIPKQDLTRAGQPDESLGERLSRVRESQGLTVREVAMRLAIDTHVIEALEAERFQELGAPIYVRGYLVRYARLLGLPEKPLVEAYRNRAPVEPPPLKPASTIPVANGERRWGARWLAYLLLLAGVIWLGWLGLQEVSLRQEDDFVDQESQDGGGLALPQPGPAAEPEPRTTVGTPLPAPAAPAPAEPPPAEPPPTAPRPPVAGAADTAPSPPDPAPVVPAQTAVTGNGVAVPDQPPQDPPVAPVSEDTLDGQTPQAPAEAVPPPEEPADQAPQPPPGQARLVMTFNADCWVDVKDAANNRLAYGVMKADTVQTLTGPAPFSLVLGNAQAVTLTINGQTVAPDRYVPSRGSVARVVLEAPAG